MHTPTKVTRPPARTPTHPQKPTSAPKATKMHEEIENHAAELQHREAEVNEAEPSKRKNLIKNSVEIPHTFLFL
jgi:hypothetical protein